MGTGVHTSRVVRNSKRIGDAYGVDVQMCAFYKNIMITILDKETQETYNKVVGISSHSISFEHNSELSALSWETYDKHLPLATLIEKYQKIVSSPRIHPLFVLILVGMANASFCRLFEGDFISMAIVFSATIIGFFLKQQMLNAKINAYVAFITSSFIASLTASTALIFQTTAETAIATSVLYLVPGVPLINGVIDILEGHTLTGFARLAEAALLIVCIAIGLSFTLLLIKDRLI
jgi:uncharacterized membrane protein YjjP (DUF1212 family)